MKSEEYKKRVYLTDLFKSFFIEAVWQNVLSWSHEPGRLLFYRLVTYHGGSSDNDTYTPCTNSKFHEEICTHRSHWAESQRACKADLVVLTEFSTRLLGIHTRKATSSVKSAKHSVRKLLQIYTWISVYSLRGRRSVLKLSTKTVSVSQLQNLPSISKAPKYQEQCRTNVVNLNCVLWPCMENVLLFHLCF